MKAHTPLHGTYSSSAAKGRPLLHAALQAEKLMKQLIGWAAQMPTFATLITGWHPCLLNDVCTTLLPRYVCTTLLLWFTS